MNLCRFLVEFGHDKKEYKFYIVEDWQEELLQKCYINVEGGCCGENLCYVCMRDGVKISYYDSIPIKNSDWELVEYMNQKDDFHYNFPLEELLERCSS